MPTKSFSNLKSNEDWNLNDLLKWKKNSKAIILERNSYFFHMIHFIDGLKHALLKYGLPASGMICENGKASQVITFQEGKINWYASSQDQHVLGKRIIEDWLKNPEKFEIFKKDKKDLEKDIDTWLDNWFSNFKSDENNVNNIIINLEQACLLMSEILAVAVYCMAVDSYCSLELEKNIKDEGERNILSRGTGISFVEREYNELLKVLVLNKNEKVREKFKKHTKKYFYIRNNYDWAEILNFKFFENRIKQEFDNLKNLQKMKRVLEKKEVDLRKRCEEYRNTVKKYSGKKISTLFSFVDTIVYQRDFSKEYQMKLFLPINSMLRKLEKAIKWPKDLIFMACPSEIGKIFSNADLWKRILQDRWKNSLIYWFEDRNSSIILTGEKAKKIILGMNKEKKVKKIIGQVAMKGGVTRGKVNIVFSPKGESFKKGDILVTDMTTPDFVPLMKKSSAIITNVGGVTCHAAIVSRELGIPCIIGTKIATKVLRDGDLVEVDANKGLIKIIK